MFPTMHREALLTVHEADALFTPPSSYSPQKTLSRLDLRLDTHSDDNLDGGLFDMNNLNGTNSPAPYIKEELDDLHFGSNRFATHNGINTTQFGGQQFSSAQEPMSGINPSDLVGNFGINNHFGASASYIPGNAGIADDELADSLGDFSGQPGFGYGQETMDRHDNFIPGQSNSAHHTHSSMAQLYSNTPHDDPIQSPFVQTRGFDFTQYQSAPQHLGMSARNMTSGSMSRHALLARHDSDSRSPLSPKGHPMAYSGTPDSGNFGVGSAPIMAMAQHRRQKSSQWDNTPGSHHSQSWIDSPTQSPHTAGMHPQIHEVMAGKHVAHASLPAKVVDMGQSQDAKKRRRRESHNLVERRRRDNINERIHDLSRLVPQHRLEDEKVRKHISNNGPLSPGVGGMSPPQATSLLAGGTGKRAAGNITTGLPLEEKDKGPNKGDILNGAVSWTSDLMWMLKQKIDQVDELSARLRDATGEDWPTERSEEERRMRTEVMDAIEKNKAKPFRYTRAPGSGLRVPKHTNIAGEPIGQLSPQSLSPGMQSGDSPNNANSNQPQFWQSGSDPYTVKEEDEFNSMDMG